MPKKIQNFTQFNILFVILPCFCQLNRFSTDRLFQPKLPTDEDINAVAM